MNIEDVQQHLPDFTFDEVQDFAQPIKEYFKYYDIDFENKMEGVAHNFGLIEAANFQIACNYFTHRGTESKGCILIVHGLYDHSGLYNHLIENCLQQGFDVLAFDLPGHGLSSGPRVSIDSFDRYQLVLKGVTSYFSSHTHIVVLMGQSTGASIVMHYLFDYPEADLKAVLLAPLFKPYGWRFSKFLYLLLNNFVKRVPRSFSKNSNDDAFVNFIKNGDPLQSRYSRVDWVGALNDWISSFKYFKANKSKVLIVQGTKDATVDWQYNLPVIHKKLPHADIEYVEEAGHHLVKESEPIRAQVFSYINKYLENI